MNEQNKILKVNSSSLVDLKAELIRKQQEFRKEKAAGGTRSALLAAKRAAHKKVGVFSKKNSGVQERALRDVEEKAEQDDAINRSRSILEAKAKLYEKMRTGGGLDLPDDDDGGRFLVEFQKKSVDNALQKRLEMRRQEEEEERVERNKLLEEQKQSEERKKRETEEERKELLQEVPAPNDPQEEWVDYTDSLGRSRRCLRKDLPALIQQDKSLVSDDRETVDSSKLNVKEKDLMSADMYREMLRERWEAEQQEMLDKQDTVHYANVRFDEKRTHGVGFYDLAKDEESRQEQLKALSELRTQTLEARKRKEKLKEKRKNMMATRLAKVRQRKMVNNPGADAEELTDSDDEHFIGPSLNEAAKTSEPELLTRDDALRRNAPMREWDKGKKDTSTWLDQPHKDPEKNYIESRRDEREAEFAPPQAYYESDNKQPRNRVPARREKKDLFSKLDSMAQLDHSGKNTRADFGPPSDYFTVPVKKPKLNPMASLEKEAHASSFVGDVINSELSSIRAEVEGKSNPKPNTHVNISDIPLPPEKEVNVTDDYQQESINYMYQEHELHFYPGQFPMGQQYIQHNVPPPSIQIPGPGMIAQPQHLAAVSHNHSDTMPSDVATGNPVDEAISVDQQPFDAEQNSLEMTSDQNTSSLKQAPPTGTISAAPMIYDRAGSRVGAPVKPRYERVHLHQVPLTLPAPPSAGNMPYYPSQEDSHQLKQDKQEKDSVKHWLKQYNKPNPSTANIPFPSPYVQNEPNKMDLFETAGFDPSKPPPNSSASE